MKENVAISYLHGKICHFDSNDPIYLCDKMKENVVMVIRMRKFAITTFQFILIFDNLYPLC